MWTKGDFVRQAYAELALAGYEFDLQPEEIQQGCVRLDAMMASWWNIRIGYAQSATPKDTDPEQLSGVPDIANEAIFMNLAMKLAAADGKTPMRTTAIAARSGYDMLLSRAVSQDTQPMQLPGTMPAGAGNRRYYGGRRYLPPPTETLDAGPDGPLTFN